MTKVCGSPVFDLGENQHAFILGDNVNFSVSELKIPVENAMSLFFEPAGCELFSSGPGGPGGWGSGMISGDGG